MYYETSAQLIMQQPKCGNNLSAHETYYVNTMEHYPQKEMKPYHTTTWKNLGSIMLIEMNHTQQKRYCIIVLNDIPKTGNFMETKQITGYQGQREKGMGLNGEFLSGMLKCFRNIQW